MNGITSIWCNGNIPMKMKPLKCNQVVILLLLLTKRQSETTKEGVKLRNIYSL